MGLGWGWDASEVHVSDIGSGIAGTFNQATLAAQRAEAENSRTRKSQQQRTSEARRRYVAAQEEEIRPIRVP